MRKFEISDRFTTADIGLDLEADSLEGLFVAGAEGMFAIIFSRKPATRSTDRRNIHLKSTTVEQLLIDWLSDLLYLFDTDGLIACNYQLSIKESSPGYELNGMVDFQQFAPMTDVAEHEIKAVTYYKLEIRNIGGVFRCHVVFDI